LGGRLLPEASGDELAQSSMIWTSAVLYACYVGGLGLGLFVSTVVGSERAAVTLVPLLVMPQLLISAVATDKIGYAVRDSGDTGPFRPLYVTLFVPSQEADWPTTSIGKFSGRSLDVASLLTYSRPAVNLLCKPAPPKDAPAWFWLWDMLQLVVLVTITWLATFWIFLRREGSWAKLVGVG